MKNKLLLAPNGKPSNLTPAQYKLVRTPAFLNWFGDWEKDPANSSKVVDDNGEPLIVYHGTPYGGFYEFDLNNIGKSTIPYWGKGIYVTASKFYAKGYAENKRTDSQQIYNLFAKCLNPYIVKRHLIGKDAYMKMIEENQYNDFNDFLIDNDYDSVIILDGESMKDAIEIMMPLSNQIKIADGTNTTFDSSNNDIRFELGGKVDEKDFIIGSKYFYKNQYMDEPINLKLIDKQELSNNQIESLTFKKENGTTLTLKKHELEYLFKDNPVIDGYGFVKKLDNFISIKTGYSPEQSFGLIEIIDNKKPNGNFKLNFVEEVKDGRVSKFNISKPLILINKTYSHKGISLKITKIDYIDSDQQESESDNKYFNHYYNADVKLNFDSDIYEDGGMTESTTPDYLRMFLGK